MMTTFDNDTHYGVFMTGTGLDSMERIRASELALKALKQVGVLSTLEIGISAPGDNSKLWLDKSTDPDELKYHNGSSWVGITTEKFAEHLYTVSGLEATSFNWQGSWSSVIEYVANDVVANSTDGSTKAYICTATNINKEPGVAADWESYWGLMIEGGTDGADGADGATGPTGPTGATGPDGDPIVWRGAHADATTYSALDAVSNDGNSYICKLGHTSSASTEPGVGASSAAYWDLMAAQGAAGTGSGDMLVSTYDPAGTAQQVVGISATQTMSNKTLTSPVINTPDLSADSVDAITEIAAALKTGADATLVTGTAGSNGDGLVWNGDGDVVSAGTPTKPKNYVINGDMQVWQRGTSGFPSGGFGPDRWLIAAITTAQRSTDRPSAHPEGYSLEFSQTLANYPAARYRVPANTAKFLKNKVLTLTFWANCVDGGNADLASIFWTADAEDDFSSQTSVVGSAVEHATNPSSGWVKYTRTIDLDSVSNVENGLEFRIYRDNDAANTTTRICRVSLTIGDHTMLDDPFEDEIYGETLNKCLPFFERIVANLAYTRFGTGYVHSTGQARVIVNYAVKKSTPTITISNASHFGVNVNGTIVGSLTSIVPDQAGLNVAALLANKAASFTVGHACLLIANNSTSAYVDIESEI
jgi:hypothetical protein